VTKRYSSNKFACSYLNGSIAAPFTVVAGLILGATGLDICT
jgi:hypothetical protein